MGKIEFDIKNIKPNAHAGYNLLDPFEMSVNKALGSYGAIPPFIIPDKKDIITKVDSDEKVKQDFSAFRVIHSQMPFRVKRKSDSEWFTLPMEPLVSVSGQNNIVRRNVAKSEGYGTIKERWSQDDYTVTIHGVLSISNEVRYPKDYVQRLREILDEKQSIMVEQEILMILGICYLSISSVKWPHTKGLNNQNYEIEAYSDSDYELLISI